MKAIMNMKIGTKLGAGFGSLLMLMVILAAIAWASLNSVTTAMERGNDVQVDKLGPIYVMREALGQTGLAARNAYIFKSDSDAQKELTIVDQQKEIYLSALKELRTTMAENKEFEAVSKGLLQMAEELRRPRAYREAGKMSEYGDFLVHECSPLRRQIVADMDVLLARVKREADVARTSASQTSDHSRAVILTLACIALVASTVIALLITKGLLKQLGGEPSYAAEIAAKIASGDLSIEVRTKQGDSTSLLFAIRTMRESLASIVTRVRAGTSNIETAATEIATGNHDLSRRTEEQAGVFGGNRCSDGRTYFHC